MARQDLKLVHEGASDFLKAIIGSMHLLATVWFSSPDMQRRWRSIFRKIAEDMKRAGI